MTARVLIVDDIAFNIKLLETKLKQEYYEVFTATNGIEAIERVKEVNPDIILMDVMMPEMDGFEATRKIKSDPNATHIPVIMVTALNAHEDKVNGLNAGADDFLTKPINDHALMTRMRSLLRLKFMTDELRVREQTAKQFGMEEHPLINDNTSIEGHKILLVDDDIPEIKKISEKLAEAKISIDSVSKEEEAIKKALSTDYSLCIVSTQLIDSDGLRLCSHIRSNDKLRNIPLLVLIEENDDKVLTKALEMGVNDYLISPVDPNELLARTKTQLRRKQYQDALRSNYIQSISLSVTDSLTNLYNRRYFDSHLKNLVEEANSKDRLLSIFILDIDFFKKVNDTYGHQAGDAVIQEVAKRITMSVRPTDLCARYGGEEFVVILPETNTENAYSVAERIRQVVEIIPFRIPVDPKEIRCTVSIGLGTLVKGDTPDSLLQRADEYLYKAKEEGRNRVIKKD